MTYLLIIVFVGFLVLNIYITQMNWQASVKRTAFRASLISLAVFLAVYSTITIPDKIFLLVVLPVLALVTFGLLKFTKFCNWCGRRIQTNLPFRPSHCPRCGTEIS